MDRRVGRQETRSINWERVIQIARAQDAVENGGMYRNRWGQRFFNPVENPYEVVAAYRASIGTRNEIGSNSPSSPRVIVIEGAAQTKKEAKLLSELQRRQRGLGFGEVEVTRYSPGRPVEKFYRSLGK
jgi:hypothetical protein